MSTTVAARGVAPGPPPGRSHGHGSSRAARSICTSLPTVYVAAALAALAPLACLLTTWEGPGTDHVAHRGRQGFPPRPTRTSTSSPARQRHAVECGSSFLEHRVPATRDDKLAL